MYVDFNSTAKERVNRSTRGRVDLKTGQVQAELAREGFRIINYNVTGGKTAEPQ